MAELKTFRGKFLHTQQDVTIHMKLASAASDYRHAIRSPEFVEEWGDDVDAYQHDMFIFLDEWWKWHAKETHPQPNRRVCGLPPAHPTQAEDLL